jgi:hypothetical protein
VSSSGNFKSTETHRFRGINLLPQAILFFSLTVFAAQAFCLSPISYPIIGATGVEQERGDSHANTSGHDANSFSASLPRYVIVNGNSNDVIMSGRKEDLEHAQKLREKIKGDFIWFRREEKSYIITDPGFIARVRAVFAEEEEVERKQAALSRQEEPALSSQAARNKQGDNTAAKSPDPALELDQVRARIKGLESSGAAQDQVAALQMRSAELERQIAISQSKAALQDAAAAQQDAKVARNQEEIARQQAELARRQSDSALRASRKLRDMLEEAVAKGIAKPE